MDFDFLVIGAGVVGLATAEYFSRNNLRVLLIEKENKIGTGVSSRNSEVIHAGIYYPKDSLKSKLCLRGKALLYEWCRNNKVSHLKLGKFVIATNNDEFERLQTIQANALKSGLEELSLVSKEEILKEEPNIFCTGGLYSPTTGILSAHELMDSLFHKSLFYGADLLFNSSIQSVAKNSRSDGYLVQIKDSTSEVTEIEVGGIINCAGLYADQVADRIGIHKEEYKQKFIKGNYFRLKGKKEPFKHLIYPVPMPKLHGLGVHVTIDLNRGVRFGPDVEKDPLEKENYDVNESRKDDFFKAIKKYFPSINYDDLMPDMAGIRPRLAADKEFNDFIISEEGKYSFPNVINCIGIESPGLTSSLAIAEYIYNMILSKNNSL